MDGIHFQMTPVLLSVPYAEKPVGMDTEIKVCVIEKKLINAVDYIPIGF